MVKPCAALTALRLGARSACRLMPCNPALCRQRRCGLTQSDARGDRQTESMVPEPQATCFAERAAMRLWPPSSRDVLLLRLVTTLPEDGSTPHRTGVQDAVPSRL